MGPLLCCTWKFKQVVFAFCAKPLPTNTTFSDYYSERRQTLLAYLRGRRRPNMGFADRGPTPGSRQPPRARTESCQPWRGAGRAGEECRQHYTGDHGYEDQEHAGHTLHADTAGVLQLPFPSVAPGVGQIIFIPACVPEYSAPAGSIHHVNSAQLC